MEIYAMSSQNNGLRGMGSVYAHTRLMCVTIMFSQSYLVFITPTYVRKKIMNNILAKLFTNASILYLRHCKIHIIVHASSIKILSDYCRQTKLWQSKKVCRLCPCKTTSFVCTFLACMLTSNVVVHVITDSQ